MPSRRTGSVSAARSRAATSLAAWASRIDGSSTANSSPPSRATTSPGRTLWVSRWPTICSSRSPTGWPRVSLTSLNRRGRAGAGRRRSSSRDLGERLLGARGSDLAVGQPGELVVHRLVVPAGRQRGGEVHRGDRRPRTAARRTGVYAITTTTSGARPSSAAYTRLCGPTEPAAPGSIERRSCSATAAQTSSARTAKYASAASTIAEHVVARPRAPTGRPGAAARRRRRAPPPRRCRRA